MILPLTSNERERRRREQGQHKMMLEFHTYQRHRDTELQNHAMKDKLIYFLFLCVSVPLWQILEVAIMAVMCHEKSAFSIRAPPPPMLWTISQSSREHRRTIHESTRNDTKQGFSFVFLRVI
jgi:hypothetical protein